MLKIQKVTVLLLTISFFLFSCSNSNQIQNDEEDSGTLRNQTEEILKTFSWTEELEKGRLLKNVSRYRNISEKVTLNALSVLNNIPEKSEAQSDEEKFKSSQVYFPVLKGFSSLDISLIPDSLCKKVKEFANFFIKSEKSKSKTEEKTEEMSEEKTVSIDSFMAKDCLYSLALFYDDLKKLYPDAEKFEATQFLFGSASINGTSYQISIRFFVNSSIENFIDVDTFWLTEDSSWKIDQIRVIKKR